MSLTSALIPSSAGGLAATGLAVGANTLATLLGGTGPVRSIGGIQAQCTIEEVHQDQLQITDHPVELGASISDHAFKLPVQVDVTIGWGAGQVQPLAQIYQRLLALQASAKPFSILTGKRKYRNMLITSISVTTDADTENVLLVRVSCREVILVQTQVTALPAGATPADPSATAAPQNSGTVQPQTPSSVPAGGALPVGG